MSVIPVKAFRVRCWNSTGAGCGFRWIRGGDRIDGSLNLEDRWRVPDEQIGIP